MIFIELDMLIFSQVSKISQSFTRFLLIRREKHNFFRKWNLKLSIEEKNLRKAKKLIILVFTFFSFILVGANQTIGKKWCNNYINRS